MGGEVTRAHFRLVLLVAAGALLAPGSAAWAQGARQQADKPSRTIVFPDIFKRPADDFTRSFADTRKDVDEAFRPLPPSGPANTYCSPGMPVCP